jgi:hypothetical protein
MGRKALLIGFVFALLIFSMAFSCARDVKWDEHYVLCDNGIVYDENTRLEWVVGPDKDTDWNEAKAWVDNLSLAGGGWRMPTTEELKGLYKKGRGRRNMTPLLKTTGWQVWSGETRSSSDALRVGFRFCTVFLGPRSHSFHDRAFAVRPRK